MRVLIVEAYGLKFVVDENARFIVEEDYEPFLKDVVKLRLGDVFVDVGAHVGKYSFYASRLVGDSGTVITIEPHLGNMANLKKAVSLDKFSNVVAVQKKGEHDQDRCQWTRKRSSARSSHDLSRVQASSNRGSGLRQQN